MQDFVNTALLEPLETLGKSVLALLPNVLALCIILSVGLVAAWVTGHLVERVLRVVGLDRLCERLGVNAALLRGGVKTDPSRLVGQAAYWVLLLFAGTVALGALNLQPINRFAQSLLAYLPRLFTASLILLAGHLLSNFVSQAVLIGAVNAGLPPARLLAACSRWGVQAVAVAMGLEQLGVAETVVVVGFGIVLGGVVLAAAMAFGLGAKDLAKDFLEQRLSGRLHDRMNDDLKHL
ncbi:MAG: mechanosensitive ion channel family protein [Burkholderiales bacterium]